MRQIVAGYYDSADVRNRLKRWLDTVKKHEGVVGVIYTTWSSNYSHMDEFCRSLRALAGEE
jgi:GH25 family lysozyme M1 (1,4-beta-N-acetylmuramidase)